MYFSVSRWKAHQRDVNGELHSDADGRDQDDHRDGAEFDADQAHDAKQLHRHHGQDEHLRRRDGKEVSRCPILDKLWQVTR